MLVLLQMQGGILQRVRLLKCRRDSYPTALSKIARGGCAAQVVSVSQAGCKACMKEDIKSFHPEYQNR